MQCPKMKEVLNMINERGVKHVMFAKGKWGFGVKPSAAGVKGIWSGHSVIFWITRIYKNNAILGSNAPVLVKLTTGDL